MAYNTSLATWESFASKSCCRMTSSALIFTRLLNILREEGEGFLTVLHVVCSKTANSCVRPENREKAEGLSKKSCTFINYI